MLTGEEMVAAIEQAGEDYARFVESQPADALQHRPAPDEWSAAELTGHVAEFPATFAEQARRLAENPGSNVGRTADDPGRLAAVPQLLGANPAEAAAAVRGNVQQALGSLRAIPPERWQARGQHVRLGELTVGDLVEHFILDHLRDHLEQARKAVGSR